MRACRSPKLIAAYYVLHRLLIPRHSPCALISLTNLKLVLITHNLSIYLMVKPQFLLYANFKEHQFSIKENVKS